MTHTDRQHRKHKIESFYLVYGKKECFFVSSIFIISLFFIDPNGLIDVIYRKVICMMCVSVGESCEMCIYM